MMLFQTRMQLYRKKFQSAQTTKEWEKLFTMYTFDKGLLFRIEKKFQKLNYRNTNNLILEWEIDVNRHLLKEDIQVAKAYMKYAKQH